MSYTLNGVRFEIPSGLHAERFALLISNFANPDVSARLIDFYADLESAKREANQRWTEFNPGMAIILDTKSGETIKSHNWAHDCLLWETVAGSLR